MTPERRIEAYDRILILAERYEDTVCELLCSESKKRIKRLTEKLDFIGNEIICINKEFPECRIEIDLSAEQIIEGIRNIEARKQVTL